ncbi:hypothetical protein MBLNU230_g2396t2 [Neophaeotheca triangularis]
MAAHRHSSSASINHASPRLHKLTSHSYLLNPFTILTCLARPTTVFTTFFILLSISHACQAKTTTSAFALAIASYISLHPAFLLPPIALLTHDRLCLKFNNKPPEPSSASTSSNHLDDSFAKPNAKTASPDLRHHPRTLRSALSYLLPYLLTLLLLLTLSTLLLPSPTFLVSLYLTPLTLPDLTPNTGLWWYFFIEIFDPFRAFFLGVFWLHMLSYSLPFCLKFSRQPLAAVVLMLGITTIFEPYAHIGSAGAWLATLTLLGHGFELATTHRYTFPALVTLVYSSLLGPAFHHLWLYAGSGNANFFYAITLVWNLGLLVLLTDMVYSLLRDEWESERPEGRGKDVRQI